MQKSVLNAKCVFDVLNINLSPESDSNSDCENSDIDSHSNCDCSETDTEYYNIMPDVDSDMVLAQPLWSEHRMFWLRQQLLSATPLTVPASCIPLKS